MADILRFLTVYLCSHRMVLDRCSRKRQVQKDISSGYNGVTRIGGTFRIFDSYGAIVLISRRSIERHGDGARHCGVRGEAHTVSHFTHLTHS